jgi:acetate kinase
MQKEKMTSREIDSFLNKKCGLLGISGKSADTRELIRLVEEPPVKLALEMFSYRVRKYVGAYLAVLGGAEAIVVGGGIGEDTPVVREQIFNGFGWAGATLDADRNRQSIDCEGQITTQDSAMPIWVIPTKENLMIAREIVDCCG